MRLSQVQNQILRSLMAYVCLTKATLAINGAGAATIKTTGSTTYTSDGVLLTKAALAAQVLTPDATVQTRVSGQAGYYVQPVSSTVYYVVGLDAAGNVRVIQGLYAGYVGPGPNPVIGDAANNSGVPEDIGTYTPIGIIKVVTNGATTFTPATTLLDAAGLTVTYTDVCLLPSANP
jgi:hypothetical protein